MLTDVPCDAASGSSALGIEWSTLRLPNAFSPAKGVCQRRHAPAKWRASEKKQGWQDLFGDPLRVADKTKSAASHKSQHSLVKAWSNQIYRDIQRLILPCDHLWSCSVRSEKQIYETQILPQGIVFITFLGTWFHLGNISAGQHGAGRTLRYIAHLIPRRPRRVSSRVEAPAVATRSPGFPGITSVIHIGMGSERGGSP